MSPSTSDSICLRDIYLFMMIRFNSFTVLCSVTMLKEAEVMRKNIEFILFVKAETKDTL